MWFGGTSSNVLTAQVKEAISNPDVKAIMLNINSPGGEVDGLIQLSDAIFEARKVMKVVAQVDSLAASAGFWIAAQAESIFATTEIDQIGSIGVRTVMHDFSKHFEELGIRVIPVDTGPFKSAGLMGTEITEEQEAEVQKLIDEVFEVFKKHIFRGRPALNKGNIDKVSLGNVFHAPTAIGLGLADKIQDPNVTLAKMGGRSVSGRKAGCMSREIAKAKLDLIN